LLAYLFITNTIILETTIFTVANSTMCNACTI